MKRFLLRLVASALIPLLISGDPAWSAGISGIFHESKTVSSNLAPVMYDTQAFQSRLSVAYKGSQPAIRICQLLTGAAGVYTLYKDYPFVTSWLPALSNALHTLSQNPIPAILTLWGVSFVAVLLAMIFIKIPDFTRTTTGGISRLGFIASLGSAAVGLAVLFSPLRASGQEPTLHYRGTQSQQPSLMPRDVKVPDIENATESWFKGNPPTQPAAPLKTVSDVVNFVLENHYDIAGGYERSVAADLTLSKELMKGSNFTVTSDLNHPGPQFTGGTAGSNTSLRDWNIYPIPEYSNTSGELVDMMWSGMVIHLNAKGDKKIWDARRLKVRAESRANYVNLIEQPAERIVREKVMAFLELAKIDSQIYYKELEIQRWTRAIASWVENQRDNANNADRIKADFALSKAKEELIALQGKRKTVENEFWKQLNPERSAEVVRSGGEKGGLQPFWQPGHMKTPTTPPTLSSRAFLIHLAYRYHLNIDPNASPAPKTAASAKRQKSSAANSHSTKARELSWVTVAEELAKKGKTGIAQSVLALSRESADGINLADERSRELYLRIEFPVRADASASNLLEAFVADPDPNELLGLEKTAQAAEKPAASAQQRYLTLKRDLINATINWFNAQKANLTHVDIKIIGVLAAVLNMRLEGAISGNIGTKEQKQQITKDVRVENADLDALATDLKSDKSKENTEWSNLLVDKQTKNNQVEEAWLGLAGQVDLLRDQLVVQTSEGPKAFPKEARPELADPVLNSQSAMSDIEAKEWELIKSEADLELRSSLRERLYSRLADLALGAARYDAQNQITQQIDDARENAQRKKNGHSSSSHTNQLFGLGIGLFGTGGTLLDRIGIFGEHHGLSLSSSLAASIISPYGLSQFANDALKFLSGPFMGFAHWLSYSNEALSFASLILMIGLPYVALRWFRKNPKLALSVLLILSFGVSGFLPLVLLPWKIVAVAAFIGAAVAFVIFVRAFMSNQDRPYPSALQSMQNEFSMGRRLLLHAVMAAATIPGLQLVSRVVLPIFLKASDRISGENKQFEAASGLVGIAQDEYTETYVPPLGISGSVERVRWPLKGVIAPNQTIVFWNASQATREIASEIGLNVAEPPGDAIFVLTREDSPFDTHLNSLYQEYKLAQGELEILKQRHVGNLPSPQIKLQEEYIDILKNLAQKALNSAEQYTWRAPAHEIHFDLGRTLLANQLDSEADSEKRKVGAQEPPLMLYKIPYYRPHFTFTQDQAKTFALHWNSDAFLRLTNGQEIALKDILGIKPDFTTAAIFKEADPFQARFFVSLRPGINLDIPKDQSLGLVGFFHRVPGKAVPEQIEEHVDDDTFIGFISPIAPIPVQNEMGGLKPGIQAQSNANANAARQIEVSADREDSSVTNWGYGGMDNGDNSVIDQVATYRLRSAEFDAAEKKLRNEEKRLSQSGVDLSRFSQVASGFAADGLSVLYTSEVDAWLNRGFNNSSGMQMNGSHPAWFRLLSKAAPRLEVDVKVPFNVHEVQAQVTLPAQSGETATAYDTKTVTMNYEDDRIAQGFKQLEVSQITLADYLKQFPTGASPASGFVIVRRTPAETQHAALDRRSFLLGKFRTPPTMVSTVLLLALVSALKCFAAAGAVSGESTLLVQIVALAIGYGLLTLSWSLATTIRSAVKERRGRLERNLEYVRSKPPSPRAFQEATALPPNSKGVSNISDRWNSVQGPLTLAELDLFSKSDGDLNRLTPGEVTVEWQPGWAGIKAWFQDDRLTVFQRCLNWIPAVLDVKTTFRIYPHRLIYTTYKAFNVSLWQCWVLYNKYKHNKSAWKADNKKLHYLSLLGIFLVAAAGLYLFRPKTLVEIGFIIKMAQPYSPWLAQHTSPLFLSIFLFFLIGLLGRGIFLFYGEGGPIYWWALKFAGFFLASRFPASMEDDFFAKTNQKISHVVDFVDGDVLGRTMNGQINGNIKSFESNLNRIGAELSVGLTRRLRDRSLDSQINLADSFFEYDRKVASGEIRSSLSSIGLDLAKHDPILSKNWSKISQKDMARARLDLVIDRLEKGNHPRGLLFALVATDNLELALDGLDHERTVALRPTLQALPGRTASLVPGLFDVYSESVREHQQFKDINKDIRLLNGAPQDRNKLRTKFISLYNGESKMQGMLDLVFDPRDIKVPLVNTNTFMFLDQRRWQKTDPDKMRDDLDSLPDPGATEGTVRNTDYFEDVFLRGSNGDAMVTGARLLMAERHGGGLLEGLAYFGIPLVPDSHKRGVYVGQEMLTNPRSAVRTLDLLRRVMRAKVVVISATQIMDNFILLLKMRIPKRLQFLASRQIVPLYSSQFDPKRIADAPVGQEPIVVFGAEPSSTQKYFPWKNAIRVIPAAPHLFVLVFLLAIVRREPAWLNAAFDHIEKDPRLTLEERQKLTWLRRNLLGEDGLAIGHYLEDVIGTAWAEQDEIPVQRFANIPDLPARNADGGWDQAEKKQIEDALRNIGRWDTNEIIAPSHWPLQSHKDVDHREREAA